jgi:hypothetical protein
MIKNSLFLLLFVILATSCNKTFENQEEMTTYLKDEDNGYIYTKSLSGINYVLQYRPTDLIVKRELTNINDKTEVKALREKYCKFLYFNLSMSKNNQELLNSFSGNEIKFGKLLNDLAFNIDKKIYLYTPKKDTLHMLDFIYPRMFGMSNNTTIMIVFPRKDKYLNEPYLNFIIKDLGDDNSQEIKFVINTQKIKEEPQLLFN